MGNFEESLIMMAILPPREKIFRIVNGYDPENRPWLALIIVEGGACGGALVNKR